MDYERSVWKQSRQVFCILMLYFFIQNLKISHCPILKDLVQWYVDIVHKSAVVTHENGLNTKLTIYRQVHYLSWNHFTFFLFPPLLINKYTRESTYDVQLYYMCYVLQTNIHSDTSMMNHIVFQFSWHQDHGRPSLDAYGE